METIRYWVDGGVLGKNPSRRGVYWSMLCEGELAPRRRLSEEYHTNNDAEWLALREALRHAAAHHTRHFVTIYSDSRLVTNQFNGVWRSKIERHASLKYECKRLAAGLRRVTLVWRPRKVLYNKLGH